MLYLIYGSDFEKARERGDELQESLVKKKPNASIFRFNAENWDTASFDELVKSIGLFENRNIVVLDRVFENEEAKDFVLKNLKDLEESPHIFILLEGKLDKVTATRIEKKAEKTEVFSAAKESKKEKFSVFSLTFPFEYRDKRKLWILYQEARKNAAPEEIHGILWWKLKQMMLSGKVGRASKYGATELGTLAAKMVSIYHNAHRGLFDFDLALEKFILEI
ncbi:MAG TPA: hypothetical protein VFA52_03290 [Candidatus Paceibacterota bacterium]|nr:hypothetical protein [Candidatus Paceibacterota bacterium]